MTMTRKDYRQKPSDPLKHRFYFMGQQLHDLARSNVVQESPLDVLTPGEWLTVLHHLHAHEVEGVRSKGSLRDILGENTDRFFLYGVARDYLMENNEMDIIHNPKRGLGARILDIVKGQKPRKYASMLYQCSGSLIPESEREIAKKAKDLVELVDRKYVWVNVSGDPEKVIWDLQKNALAA